MRKLNLFLTLLMFMTKTVIAQNIKYTVSIPEPQTKYALVQIEILNNKSKEIKLSMPVWTTGSYMVREFSRNVQQLAASDLDGSEIASEKINKNTWVVKANGKNNLIIRYSVYANEVSVRTTFIQDDQAFLLGTSLFMQVHGMENNKGSLHIQAPEKWKNIACGMENIAPSSHIFSFGNYDELVDCPIQLGNFEILEFRVNNIPHYVALVGENNADKAKLTKDLKTISEKTAAIVPTMEFSKYWYIVHHVENGGGGLEHSNSCAVVMPRFAYTDPVKYDNFISLCAHEYFHAWNVKRIRPIELGPFDYNNEVYTKQLWVAEGITSYYDELLMLRAGFWNKEKYLQNLATKLNYNDNTPGAKIQSLAESSMDAWIKFYRPDENSANVSISYYTKGALVAALLDLTIMQQTKGAKNLDNLMQLLYNEYYIKKKRGFTEQEFIEAAESIANTKLKNFFDTWVYGTKTIDYSTYFKIFGILVNKKNTEGSYLGANTRLENGKQIVRSVDSNSPAFSLGLTLNDEIVTVNGYRITDDFTKYIQNVSIGTEVNLTILRNGKKINIKTKTIANPKVSYSLTIDKDINNEQKRMLQIWLGKITE